MSLGANQRRKLRRRWRPQWFIGSRPRGVWTTKPCSHLDLHRITPRSRLSQARAIRVPVVLALAEIAKVNEVTENQTDGNAGLLTGRAVMTKKRSRDIGACRRIGTKSGG